MSLDVERLKLGHALEICFGHADALSDALTDLADTSFSVSELANLSSQHRRLLDQFAYRFTRLQDDMGGRLFPGLLGALGEEFGPLSMIDRLNRLEQLGWIPQVDEWLELRRIRNEFTHDYPENFELRLVRLRQAMEAAARLIKILKSVMQRLDAEYPGIGSRL